jgi:hypothetical protein
MWDINEHERLGTGAHTNTNCSYGSSFKPFSELAGKFTGIATVNKEMHMNIVGHLKDAVTRKRLENWRTNSWFVLHDVGSLWSRIP